MRRQIAFACAVFAVATPMAFAVRHARLPRRPAPVTAPASAPAPISAPQSAPAGLTVWVNTKTGVFHRPGSRWYGATKQGQYVAEADALAAGDRPAANGQ